MDAGFADEVVDPCDVVHDGGEVGDDVADAFSGLPVGFEIPDGGFPWSEPVLEGFDGFAEVAGLAVSFDEFGFEVEKVEVACCACHEKLDDAFGAGWSRWRRAESVGLEEGCECDAAEAAAALPEEIFAGEGFGEGVVGTMKGRVHVRGWFSRRRRTR